RRLAVYDPLGWYDYTFLAAETLTEMTEDLVDENVTVLEELRKADVRFDAYMFDDWWEPTDLDRFRDRAYPHGGKAVADRVRRGGMQPGLWFATTCAGWTCHQAPGMERAIAGGSGVPLPAGHPGPSNWVELFTNAHTRDKRFCLAAEPYRTMVLQALPQHVRDLGLVILKLDCVTRHCTSSAHDHRPGRYSVEAMMAVVLETVAAAQQANPDLLLVWYWGFRSPWWLKYGDVAFDKGLKMEAASPASAPGPSYRQSVSLNIDQAIQHATLLPLSLQDSLGVWLGEVAWANRMGKEDWRDAFLLDVARGSAMVQLWGDVGLLDRGDVDYLAGVLQWMRATEAFYRTTIRVGGDAWRAEPYGYAQQTATGAVITLFNPQFEATTVSVDLAPLGISTRGTTALYELYPFPGLVADRAIVVASTLSAPLKPFEVRCLELIHDPSSLGAVPPQNRPPDRPGRALDLVATPGTNDDVGSAAEQSPLYRGTTTLPAITRGQRLAVIVRLHRQGEWWYHPEPHSLIRFTGTLDGLDVVAQAIPRWRSYNGPGAPWVVYDMPAGPSWEGKRLSIELSGQLPGGVALSVETRTYDAWWRQVDKRFAPR
ncbi:MAG TPA: hypothetical protein VHB98_07050, partial [Chloroflexota bacterium]|nr:hypothetical protein [Chloroflexota bacterium]